MKHLIIGGVAGGATAAARIRRLDEEAEIVLLEKGGYISYANCGLPYYIGGVIEDRQNLFVQTPKSFSQRFHVDVRVESEAVAIDTDRKTVLVRRRDGSEYTESYDKLLLSPGSSPVRPPLEGIGLQGVFTLRNVEDTDNIKAYLRTHKVKDAIVVGGGFIGLEMAENLHEAGAAVSIVEMADQVMTPVDYSTASFVHRELMDQGVGLYVKTGLQKITQRDGRLVASLSTGTELECDLLLLSVGVRPNVTLAKESGIELGKRGIKVDAFLRTSAPDVYAVGDAIEYPHPFTGELWLNYLAGPANRQARIVADNMVKGDTVKYEGAIGTSIAKVFGLTVAATGLSSKKATQLGLEHRSVIITSASNASYYPGSFQLTLKIVFGMDGKIFGAQAVGHTGVDKRIDEIAQVIKMGGDIYDLQRTEHCYAPPFSSAKDPVALAAYAAGNILDGSHKVISWREVEEKKASGAFFIDVRTPDEFSTGSIEGAVNIPLDDMRDRIREIPRDREIVVFCAVGLRGYVAQRILLGKGFESVLNLNGGYKVYSAATLEVCSVARPVEQPEEETPSAMPFDVLRVDACGLSCPGPIMKLKQAMDAAKEGERIEVVATDPGFSRDAAAWSESTGNKVISKSAKDGYHTVVFEKGAPKSDVALAAGPASKNKTFICFSDNLDKVIATFILANGAAATGHKVSIFFTFWGLNVIKKQEKPAVEKDFFGKMFGWMMASDSRKLHLSKMSMWGMGDKLIRHIMKKKNIDSPESLIKQAMDNGVEFIACQMTMDMMGIAKEELIDGVSVGGVATYMNRAEDSAVNLFL